MIFLSQLNVDITTQSWLTISSRPCNLSVHITAAVMPRKRQTRSGKKHAVTWCFTAIRKGHQTRSYYHHNQEILRGHSSPLCFGPHLFWFDVLCDLLRRRTFVTSPSSVLCASCAFFRICPHPAVTKKHKLAPYGTDGRLLLTANFKVTWHKTRDKSQKSGPDSFKYCELI